jgi:protein-S-isoprenylcysteine O-methyltransferase Ste14
MQWVPLWFCVVYTVTLLFGRVLWMRWRWGLKRSEIYGGQTTGRARQMVFVFHAITLTILGHCILWGMGRLSGFALIPVNNATQSAGCAFLLIGLGLAIIAQNNMGSAWRLGIANEPTPLRTIGLFRYVRHPIYVGMMISTAGLLVLMPTAVMSCMMLLTILGLRREAILEERHLMQLHGELYRDYCQQTGRWWPRLGPDATVVIPQTSTSDSTSRHQGAA